MMPRVLEQVLDAQSKLKLLALENIPVVAITDHPSKAGSMTLFRHGVIIELEGSYHAVLAYLQTLESLAWRLQWSSLDFEVGEYPLGKLTLKVFTYSTEKNWLGV